MVNGELKATFALPFFINHFAFAGRVGISGFPSLFKT
jgi:hypothetical protein